MKIKYFSLAIFILIIITAIYYSDRGSIERTLNKLDTKELISTATSIWIKSKNNEISKSEWGELIVKFNPERVYTRVEGLYIVTSSFFVTESGLFIIPDGSDFSPQVGGDPSYKLLREKLYWYEIKG